MILCSACLAGEKCRYDASDCGHGLILQLKKKGKVIAVCPEVFGGLSVPRPACEITGGDGHGVLAGTAKVLNIAGDDVTPALLKGAQEALQRVKANNIRMAVLKSKSASCGTGLIFDGTFSRRFIPGDGVTAALLKQNSVRVLSEEQFMAWANILEK